MLILFILLYCFAATSSDPDTSTATATDTPSFVNRYHVFRSRRLHRHRYTATDTSSEVKESVVLDLAATVFGGGGSVSGGG
ncbi:hypothetical protein Hanom_Chr01g00008941 [Helianthus anomalus]